MAAGCRCLVLTSRSGTLLLEVLQEFASAGVTVFTVSADSGDAEESAAALRWAHEHLPAVQHYAHAAGVSGFAMLDSLNEADFWDVAKPKVRISRLPVLSYFLWFVNIDIERLVAGDMTKASRIAMLCKNANLAVKYPVSLL